MEWLGGKEIKFATHLNIWPAQQHGCAQQHNHNTSFKKS